MIISTKTKTRLTKVFVGILVVWALLFIGSFTVDLATNGNFFFHSWGEVVSLFLMALLIIDIVIAATLVAVYALEYNTKNNSNPSS